MSKAIVFCNRCNGWGDIMVPGELENGHTGEYGPSTTRECFECNGKGRVIKITTIEYRKMDDDDTKR